MGAFGIVAVCLALNLSAAVSDTPDTPFRLATFDAQGRTRVGIAVGAYILDLQQANSYAEKQAGLPKMQLASQMRELIEQAGPSPKRLYQLANFFKDRKLDGLPFAFPADKVTYQAPIKYPWNMINMAFNYWGHAREMARTNVDVDPDRDDPFVFAKSPRSTLLDPGKPFYIPEGRGKMDWEGELAVVIGKPTANVSKENAMDYVFGFTIENDLSDRGGGTRKSPRFNADWFSQKNRNGAAPMGPFITPKAFIKDHHNLHMVTRVNGVTKQDGTSADMIHDVEHQVAYISSIMTLFPGDVISTGSPEGVGVGRRPPEFLKAGDVVEVEIDGIGTLRTPLEAMPKVSTEAKK